MHSTALAMPGIGVTANELELSLSTIAFSGIKSVRSMIGASASNV
jgi:HSP90 family molecular chaperone